MNKRTILLFLSILTISLSFTSAKDRSGHDSDLIGLFYDINYVYIIDESSLFMESLTDAVYLTLDYNSNPNNFASGTTAIINLKQIGIQFPFTLKQLHIPFDGGSSHEKYTHLGWEPYNGYSENVYDAWLLRKSILIETVNKVFEFSTIDEEKSIWLIELEKSIHPDQLAEKKVLSLLEKIKIGTGSKSYSFSAIIYYTHILGDILNNSSRTSLTRIPLDSLCDELKSHLVRVFGPKMYTQKIGNKLMKELNSQSDPRIILLYLQSTLQEFLPEEKFYSNSMLYQQISSAVSPLY